ncbi:MAG: ABC transporter ATP-binding protein [Coprococcus sp.]|nr:ABC transporter ATP-binding protein [Coprococcus sp.]
MQKIIKFEDVTYFYPGTEVPAIKDINLSLNEGEIVLITGPSGAGKTTLCSTLNRIVPEAYEGKLTGRILFWDEDISKYSIGQMAFKAGMLFQDPSGQLTNPTVADEVAFGPENKGMPVQRVEELISEYVGYVHMEKFLERSPQALSGGQQQSVAYASVLAMEPEVYVLDEPTSNLDPLGSDLVFELMRRLAAEKKKTVVIVEHKIEKIIDMVDRIIVMNKGSIVYDGTPNEVLIHYEDLKKIGVLVPQANQIFQKMNLEMGTNFTMTTSFEEAVQELHNYLPDKLPVSRMEEAGKHFKKPNVYTEPIVQIKDLHFSYTPEVEVLHGINLEIHKGEFLSIVGRNGSGKTTIVKCFNGLHKPTSGSVIVNGMDTKETTVAEMSRNVGYCFQNPDHQIFSSVVLDELRYGPQNLHWDEEEIEATVNEVASMLVIEDILDENPYNLSKGQRQSIAVASILCMKPDVLIVDEPTTGQDPTQSRAMMDMMAKLNKELGKTIIVITHDMSIAAEYSDRIVAMHQGEVIADGTPREVFAQEELLHSSNLEAPQITRLLQHAGISQPTVIDVDEAFELLSQMKL